MAMPIPSVPETMTALKDILTIVSEGGQKALTLIFLINLVIAGGAVFIGLKFFFNFIKNTNDRIEKVVAQKDELLNNARKRSEEQNVQYAELLARFLERENKNMSEIHELKILLTTFFINKNNS